MSFIKAMFALCCISAASALVLRVPESDLIPPKRPVPPPAPKLGPYPYPAAVPESLPQGIPQLPKNFETPAVPTPQSPPESLPSVPSAPVRPVFTLPKPEKEVPESPVNEGFFNSPLSVNPGQVPPEFRDEKRDKEGQFSLRFSNGKDTVAEETGRLLSTDEGWEYVIVKDGNVVYQSKEGSPVKFHYVADEKGVKTYVSFSSVRKEEKN